LSSRTTASPILKSSFPPIVGPDTRLLVLGSLPGEVSLARSQYYAHPHNCFWPLMAEVLEDVRAAAPDYALRLETLARHGVGLWDVVKSATRAGSLDANIRRHAPNALAELVAALPQLKAVAFNGVKAAAIGRRLILSEGLWTLIDLPSSSPANTRPFAEKRAAWLALRPFVRR
jgi:hypoxanthine-DNA glycosylase